MPPHYSFEMLAPPVGVDFAPNAEGNLYESDMGVMVLRVDAWDAYADGVPVYDLKTGEPLAPEESRRRDHDKDAWDRNYGCRFVIGGVGACGLLQLDTAQRRGIEAHCACMVIESDSDFDRAIRQLRENIGDGPVGIGMDLATTTKASSNPTAVTVLEQKGSEYIARLVCAWKTADPRVAEDRARRLVEAVAARKAGGRARRLAIDATNERYFATSLRDHLRALIPVDLVIGSETIQPSGYESMTMKQFTGSRLIAELDDNHLTLPPERYLRDDFRLVKKERGAIVCDPDVDGKHGDTFDSTKLALDALKTGGPAEASAAGVGAYGSAGHPKDRNHLRPDHSEDRAQRTGAMFQ